MIRIRKLKKKYNDTVIFDQASADFPDTGLVCIFGPSGIGKTTLFNLIAGFDRDYEGEIIVHGTNLASLNETEICAYRRDHLGFIFQNYHLLSGYTVLENIMLACETFGAAGTEEKHRAELLLKQFGMEAKAEQRAETLSGGEKQRAAAVRALINQPSILLADEPTGALDRKNSESMMKLLKELAQDHLVLVITHDQKWKEYADQIAEIHNGRLVSEFCGEKETEKLLIQDSRFKLPLMKRALKNIRVHLRKSLIAALAVSFGVVCFSLSLSFGNTINQAISEFEAKNTAYRNGFIKTNGNENEILEILEKEERIEHVYRQYILEDVSLRCNGQTAVLAEKYPTVKAKEQMSYGIMPRYGENEIAFNPSMAAKFDKNIQNLIGKTVSLTFNGKEHVLTVSGIFNGMLDDYCVSADVEQQMMQGLSTEVYSISYDAHDFESIVLVSEFLKEHRIVSQNAEAEAAAFLKTFENLKRLFSAVSGLIFGAALFIAAVILVKQQNTRYHEVGVLSALGYTRKNIHDILFYESLGLVVFAVSGSLILLLITLQLRSLVSTLPMLSGIQIIGTLLITGLLVLILSWITNFKLASAKPAEALRK